MQKFTRLYMQNFAIGMCKEGWELQNFAVDYRQNFTLIK